MGRSYGIKISGRKAGCLPSIYCDSGWSTVIARVPVKARDLRFAFEGTNAVVIMVGYFCRAGDQDLLRV